MAIRIHVFETETSAEAYDRTQTDESIHSGDVLIVVSEKIAGVMDEAWPVAITVNHGEFHGPLENGDTHRQMYPEAMSMAEFMAYAYDWELAIAPPF